MFHEQNVNIISSKDIQFNLNYVSSKYYDQSIT